MALLRLAAASRCVPLHAYLHAHARETITIAGLLTDPEAVPASEYTTLKIKVGKRPVEEDVLRVHDLARGVGPNVKLRLDANRAWSYEEALTFAAGVIDLPVEYLEEPLRDWRTLAAFARDAACPIALDETLQDIEEDDPVLEVAAALVWKPTLTTKSPQQMARWAARQARPIPLILSGAYESGVAIAAFAAYAAAFSPPDAAAGLDTYSRLGDDLLDPPLRMSDGKLTLPSWHLPLPLRQELLHLLREIA
jgi:O-succinylbenzoate synthase